MYWKYKAPDYSPVESELSGQVWSNGKAEDAGYAVTKVYVEVTVSVRIAVHMHVHVHVSIHVYT